MYRRCFRLSSFHHFIFCWVVLILFSFPVKTTYLKKVNFSWCQSVFSFVKMHDPVNTTGFLKYFTNLRSRWISSTHKGTFLPHLYRDLSRWQTDLSSRQWWTLCSHHWCLMLTHMFKADGWYFPDVELIMWRRWPHYNHCLVTAVYIHPRQKF